VFLCSFFIVAIQPCGNEFSITKLIWSRCLDKWQKAVNQRTDNVRASESNVLSQLMVRFINGVDRAGKADSTAWVTARSYGDRQPRLGCVDVTTTVVSADETKSQILHQ